MRLTVDRRRTDYGLPADWSEIESHLRVSTYDAAETMEVQRMVLERVPEVRGIMARAGADEIGLDPALGVFAADLVDQLLGKRLASGEYRTVGERGGFRLRH